MGDITTTDNSIDADEVAGILQGVRGFFCSDIGKRRSENQDSCTVVENKRYHLYVVADGMGGASGGGRASQIAVDVIQSSIASSECLNEQAIFDAIKKAHGNIVREGNAIPGLQGMGTTSVGLLFTSSANYLFNVGDSRAYHFRKGELRCLTEDHTVVGELVRAGTISAEQAKNTPVSHMLTRSLGAASEVQVDCWQLQEGIQVGDTFLLCSDGLHGQVGAKVISDCLAEKNPEKAVELLIAKANENGGQDNVTVIVIKIEQGFGRDSEDSKVLQTNLIALPSILAPLAQAAKRRTRLRLEKEVSPEQTKAASASKVESPRVSFGSSISRPTRGMVFLAGVLFAFGFLVGGILPGWHQNTFNQDRISKETRPSKADIKSFGTTSELAISDNSGSKTTEVLTSSDQFEANRQSEIVTDYDFKTLEQGASRLEEARLNLDVAIRRLILWADRQSRLQQGDLLDLAAEVSISVPTVRDFLDSFQDLHLQYLEQAEELVYHPLDTEREKKVGALSKLRKIRLNEIGKVIKREIGENLQTSITDISSWLRERDKLQAWVEAYKRQHPAL